MKSISPQNFNNTYKTFSIRQPAIGATPLLGKHEVKSANEGQFTH